MVKHQYRAKIAVVTFVAFCMMMTLALTACGSSSSNADDTLYILSSSKKVDLDPAKSQNLAITYSAYIERKLTTWDVSDSGGETTVVPDLATNIGEVSNDGKTWTYHLKDGIKFETGAEITSQDIKWGIERSFAPELSGGLTYHKDLLEDGDTYEGPFSGQDLASIQTPDDKTIVFNLNRSYGDWPWIASQPAFSPVPKGTVQTADYGKKPVSSGPYKVDSYEVGKQMVLVKNDQWDQATDDERTFDGKEPQKIIELLGQSAETATDRLIADTGNDQTAFSSDFVSPQKLAQIKANPTASKRLVTSSAGALEYLAMNTTRPGLSNLKVRQAIEYAVDKNAVRVAAGGENAGDFATTLITPGIQGRQDYDLYPASSSGDQDKAKALLSESGVDISSLNLVLVTETSSSLLNEAQAVQQALQQVGIKVTLKEVDSDTANDIITGSGEFDLVISGWQPDYPSANANLQPLFASNQIGNGNYNLSRFSSVDVDQKIAAAQSEIDETKAGQLWAEIDKEIMEQAPVVPLLYNKNTYIIGSKVSGFYIGSFPAYPVYFKIGIN
ncbi:MAG: ABC transporter substrate-binding protein [Candidatus Ancillula sp.]|jgi:peptide/nickel transport system substrate-binding protein|nr:ABC transporter substrate-binding protein [Candidatus Ancillula sp.]